MRVIEGQVLVEEEDSIGMILSVSWEMDYFQHHHPFERVKVEVWLPFDFS